MRKLISKFVFTVPQAEVDNLAWLEGQLALLAQVTYPGGDGTRYPHLFDPTDDFTEGGPAEELSTLGVALKGVNLSTLVSGYQKDQADQDHELDSMCDHRGFVFFAGNVARVSPLGCSIDQRRVLPVEKWPVYTWGKALLLIVETLLQLVPLRTKQEREAVNERIEGYLSSYRAEDDRELVQAIIADYLAAPRLEVSGWNVVSN